MQAGFVFSFIILFGRLQEYAAENTAFVQDKVIIIFSVRLEVNSGSEQLNHNACVFYLWSSLSAIFYAYYMIKVK